MDIFGCLDKLLPRYIRILGDNNEEMSDTNRVKWLDANFIAVPGTASMKGVTDGNSIAKGLYPMDAASALAVLTLFNAIGDRSSGVKCLDLCCCPGNKLLLMSDILASSSAHANDVIIGIDISKNRLNTCKSILKQVEDYYLSTTGPRQHPRHLLFEFDGQLYGNNISDLHGSLTYDSKFIEKELLHYGYHKKRNKSTRKREELALRATEEEFIHGGIIDKWNEFDYVLCDVQCTHDYSYRHMIYSTTQGGGDTSNPGYKKVITSDNIDELEVLQRQLLQNGFNLLKVGGSLVYSTCSELERQNEAVVRWLLDSNSDAVLIPLVSTPPEALKNSSCNVLSDLDDDNLVAYVNGLAEEEIIKLSVDISQEIACKTRLIPKEGTLPGTLRWSRRTYTSGLFIAKITKK